MKYKKLVAEIERLEAEIQRNRQRRSEATERINEAGRVIAETEWALAAALVGEDSKKAELLKAEISDLREKSVRHDEFLIAGLDDQLGELEAALTQAKHDRDLAFSKLAGKWLTQEIGQYDHAVKALREHLNKIISCHRMLMESGHQAVYRAAVGEAFEFLPRSKIVPIKGFARQAFVEGIVSLQGVHDAVHAEIVGKDN